ncbi:MAG TPA: sulfotransferase [Nocardioides sp.]|uniref:sulfotransferase family protein n=1 Tax=Nocardioides sp. TaxID=35761 RepID=UPI002F419231
MPIYERRQRRLAALAEAERSLPISFAIVGVQKAGTSSLYSMLVKHRQVAGGPQKELRFFLEPRDWGQPDYSDYRRPARGPQSVAGDATPGYLFYPGAMERIHRYDPGMKLLASFRDPIERAFSHWSMERRRNESYPDLPEAIERYGSDELPGPVAADAGPTPLLRGSPFARGLYGAQLERALALFPAEQWLLVEFRALLRDPRAVLDRATDLLGLPRFASYPALPRRMAGPTTNPGPRPSVVAVEGLVRRYADDLSLFADLSGLDISAWPTRQAAEGQLAVPELRDRLCDRLGLSRSGS